MSSLDPATLPALQAHARELAGLLRLPFRRRAWRGAQGMLRGSGTGNSLDFEDHRPYQPGDDPRFINWQAYARSGHYTMKLYRQETSPAVDLVIDLSASMFVDAEKAARVAELAYWTAESAMQAGATLRCYLASAGEIKPLALDELLSHGWLEPAGWTEPLDLTRVPWRHGSLRVLLSDLLWPGDPTPILHTLAEGNGAAILLAPYSRAESDPAWRGNLEMADCETGRTRPQRIEPDLMSRYREAYERHFSLWTEAGVRYQAAVARIDCALPLAESLQEHLGESGAVEWA